MIIFVVYVPIPQDLKNKWKMRWGKEVFLSLTSFYSAGWLSLSSWQKVSKIMSTAVEPPDYHKSELEVIGLLYYEHSPWATHVYTRVHARIQLERTLVEETEFSPFLGFCSPLLQIGRKRAWPGEITVSGSIVVNCDSGQTAMWPYYPWEFTFVCLLGGSFCFPSKSKQLSHVST